MEYDIKKMIRIAGLVVVSCFMTTPAFAQMAKEAWSFNTQNRASIAALMKQVDDSDRQSTQTTASGSTTLVCGGGSSDSNSSAMGNSSCIILNNSSGNIELGQDSTGDQNASSDSDVTTNLETTDEVLNALNGGK